MVTSSCSSVQNSRFNAMQSPWAIKVNYYSKECYALYIARGNPCMQYDTSAVRRSPDEIYGIIIQDSVPIFALSLLSRRKNRGDVQKNRMKEHALIISYLFYSALCMNGTMASIWKKWLSYDSCGYIVCCFPLVFHLDACCARESRRFWRGWIIVSVWAMIE